MFRSPKAAGAQPQKQRAFAAGSVCGDPSIQGEVIGRVPGKIAGCGVDNAMSIASVSGVRLSAKSTMDCDTAKALKSW
ncbi:MAG: extensin-like protein, partial [Sulfitobacter sp.]|nr:extensin-like protein [Sulfitobacter sp.]